MLRRKIVQAIELVILLWKYKRQYAAYFFKERKRLYDCLKSKKCRHIRAVQLQEWKVYYGSYYFRAILGGKRVFIKVTAPCTKDGYINEIKCNAFIRNHSEFLSKRTPEVLMSFVHEDYQVIIFEYFEIRHELQKVDLQRALYDFIDEYSRIGIIHQDLKASNITIHHDKYCIIDYGYSICPDSNHFRFAKCNYINRISDKARTLLEAADFYYDDVVASGIENVDRSSVNFIVGKGDKYYISLADRVFEYRLERLEGRPVCLLHKYVNGSSTQIVE